MHIRQGGRTVFLSLAVGAALLVCGIVLVRTALSSRTISKVAMLQTSGSHERKPSEFCAWFPYWHEPQALESFTRASGVLRAVSPVWYRLSHSGTLEPIDVAIKNELIETALNSNTRIIPTVANDFDSQRVGLLLSSEVLRDDFRKKLADELTVFPFDGIDLDWEQVDPSLGKALLSFMEDVAGDLHERNLVLSVSVHARTGAQSDWKMARTYDWERLSQFADEIRIMAYDYHTEESKPGPVTPLFFLEDVIAYAKKTIPPEKIILGLPDYGYEWSLRKNRSVSYTDAQSVVSDFQGKWERDEDSGELFGSYVSDADAYSIWIVDWESLRTKIKRAQEENIHSFCIWRLGEEDPDIWSGISAMR